MKKPYEFEVFSKTLAEFLVEEGLEVVRTRRDIANPKHLVWVFVKGPELEEALVKYEQQKVANRPTVDKITR